ncbi:hypothetical protein [Polynucleobacter sp. MWH-Aus1W21]|uniref:hypothetical protein n=1 Tax=Polynucleobacter sp. MWH-Aus1W21 TaxID=1855880 RepID=UPI001BFDEDFF|nr:hypothetical protein [Polynucleobacter sp. MWH-Aus1W21]QWD66572.1 hypothetical protein ICW03_01765 [Polynucleobacter sp. MWH-Aus1W21]
MNLSASHFFKAALIGAVSFCMLSLAVLVVGHLLLTSWRDIFFFNSDSLTLPLLLKSILSGETFEWRFSSQLFFFPEAFLYFVSAGLTPTVEWALILNAFINFLLVFTLLLWIGALSGLDFIGRLVFTVCGAVLISIYIVLEPTPAVNQTALVSLSLFNTYYFGVILASYFVLAINLCFLKDDSDSSGRSLSSLLLACAGVLILALTYGSNPLFLLQCSLPLLICLLGIYFFRGISKRTLVELIGLQLMGLFLGQCLRWYFSDSIGRSVDRYVDIKAIFQSSKLFSENIKLIWSSPVSKIEYLLIVLVICVACFSMAHAWRSFLMRRKGVSIESCTFNRPLLLLASFSLIAPLFAAVGVLASGNYLMRYFLPLAFFPILATAYLIGIAVNSLDRGTKPFLVGCVCFFLGAPGALALIANSVSPGSGSFLWWTQSHSFSLPQSIACVNERFRGGSINLVASFWTSRPIDLYTSAPVRVLQVGPGLKPYYWMNNQAPYKMIQVSGVIVDKPEGTQKWPGYLYEEDLPALGQVSDRVDCERVSIYLFNRDTEGFKKIQQMLHN